MPSKKPAVREKFPEIRQTKNGGHQKTTSIGLTCIEMVFVHPIGFLLFMCSCCMFFVQGFCQKRSGCVRVNVKISSTFHVGKSHGDLGGLHL